MTGDYEDGETLMFLRRPMTEPTETERPIIAIYADDGPARPGGQDIARTMPQRCAHLFATYPEFREADQTVGERYADRRNPRYVEWMRLEKRDGEGD